MLVAEFLSRAQCLNIKETEENHKFYQELLRNDKRYSRICKYVTVDGLAIINLPILVKSSTR